ncbi:MAG: nitroreductase family protein [Thermoleophilia bacterium]
MPTLPLSPDELLSTTRAVRKRLDLERPVEREVLEECIRLAQQAPSGVNKQDWHFVVVTDPAKRAALGELYRRFGLQYLKGGAPAAGDARADEKARMRSSAEHLVDVIQDVPVHLVPCVERRIEGLPFMAQASTWGSILPAVWSFMLAARSRGLGTCWTTFHLAYEEEAAEILGIPYASVMQTALIPVAYTKGTDFRPGPRLPLEDAVHWDAW